MLTYPFKIYNTYFIGLFPELNDTASKKKNDFKLIGFYPSMLQDP